MWENFDCVEYGYFGEVDGIEVNGLYKFGLFGRYVGLLGGLFKYFFIGLRLNGDMFIGEIELGRGGRREGGEYM